MKINEHRLTCRFSLMTLLLYLIISPKVFTQSATLATQGVHVPVLSNSQRDAVQSPTDGHLIYNFEMGCFEVFQNTSWMSLCGHTVPTSQIIKLDSTGGIQLNAPLVVGHQGNNFKWTVSTGPNFNANIELRHLVGAGIPYIDFSGNEVIDYDGRIILQSDNLMVIDGASLNVQGQVQSNGVSLASDRRFKTHIVSLHGSLAKLLKIKGYYYDWRVDDFQEKNFSNQRQIGFVAQEIEAQFPELVQTDQDGYKAVDYARLTPVLVEALKEQQVKLDAWKIKQSELRVGFEELTVQLEEAKTRRNQILAYQTTLDKLKTALEKKLNSIQSELNGE